MSAAEFLALACIETHSVRMSSERRAVPRIQVDLFFNKYIDGYPHLCRALDVSEGGLLLERVSEPDVDRPLYPVEIGVMSQVEGEAPEVVDRLWLWAKQVWSENDRQALSFIGVEERDRTKLARILSSAGYASAAA